MISLVEVNFKSEKNFVLIPRLLINAKNGLSRLTALLYLKSKTILVSLLFNKEINTMFNLPMLVPLVSITAGDSFMVTMKTAIVMFTRRKSVLSLELNVFF